MAKGISKQDIDEKLQREEWIAEEQWHIENATTNLSDFMQPVVVGEEVKNTEVFSPAGEAQMLADLWESVPALILTGSLSCPPARRFNAVANELRKEFGAQVNVVVLYLIDAHPNGDLCPYTGTDWLTSDNEAAGILVRQPVDLEQRIELASRYIEHLGLEVPVVIDNMDNAAWAALGRWPNMAVLVGNDGNCIFWQDWVSPDELRKLLADHLAGAHDYG